MVPMPSDQMTRARPPLALIVDDRELSRRSLEGILAPNGFAVISAYTGRKALARAHAHLPDVICLSLDLPDMDSLELCRALRRDPMVGERTPIVVTSPERVPRERRLAAFAAGAWHLVNFPVDAEDLVLRLLTVVDAKSETEELRDAGLLDAPTGVYNLQGLEHRLNELSSRAARKRWALACLVVAVPGDPLQTDAARDRIAAAVAETLAGVTRRSDTIGRVGQSEFAVIAPDTSTAGAVRLAERFSATLAGSPAAHVGLPAFGIRAGLDAVSNARETPVRARALLGNANIALRRAGTGGGWIQSFEPAAAADD
jgi:diguanylate cyclase (GGDEF)-like protein